MLGSLGISVVTVLLHDYAGFEGIAPTAHQVAGVLVSFLVVFRTQLANNRYWEGRGHIGLLMAGVVDTASMASVQLQGDAEETAAARTELARLLRLYFRETAAFLRAASRRTQRASNYWLPEEATASNFVEDRSCDVDATEAECEALRKAPRPPVLVLQWVRAHIYKVGVEGKLIAGETESERKQTIALGLDRVLSGLQPCFNGCAKIATTPVPQPYTQMARWLVFFFVYTLPFALFKGLEGMAIGGRIPWAFVPASALLAFGYYGLDYCANQLQNPFISEFGDVALDGRFATIVCSDVDLLLGAGEEEIDS